MKKLLLLLTLLFVGYLSVIAQNHPYGDDGLFGTSNSNISPNFVISNKWNKRSFTYAFVNYTNQLSQQTIQQLIASSFDQWRKASGGYFTFTYTTSVSSADFKISFVTGDHGDGHPFDGAGGILAHSFYPPPNGGTFAGQLHFDDAETWKADNSTPGYNLFSVATHEIGHLLGLAHSTCSDATMYAYYFSSQGVLNTDDIAGIRSLYNISNTTYPMNFIDGPSTISSNTTFNFIFRASNLTWTISPNLNIVSQIPNQSITVASPSCYGTGAGTITATDNYCGNSITTPSKNVTIPTTLFSGSVNLNGMSQITSFTNNPYVVSGNVVLYGGTSYTPFNIPSGEIYVFFNANNLSNISIQPVGYSTSDIGFTRFGNAFAFDIGSPYNQYNSIQFTIQGTDPCGNTVNENMEFDVSQGYGYYFSLSPNPASNTITIQPSTSSATAQNSSTSNSSKGVTKVPNITQVNIYNNIGKVVQTQSFNGNTNKVQLNMARLASGIYYVEIKTANYTEKQTLQIK